jgi:hypothetical protein
VRVASGRCPERIAGVGDAMVEAECLEALAGLLPGVASRRLVGWRAQRDQWVGTGVLERGAHVLVPADRQLRVELGGALAEQTAFGLPCRAVGDAARGVALALGGHNKLVRRDEAEALVVAAPLDSSCASHPGIVEFVRAEALEEVRGAGWSARATADAACSWLSSRLITRSA